MLLEAAAVVLSGHALDVVDQVLRGEPRIWEVVHVKRALRWRDRQAWIARYAEKPFNLHEARFAVAVVGHALTRRVEVDVGS